MSTAIDLRSKLGCDVVQFSESTRSAAERLSCLEIQRDENRAPIYAAILQSGWFFEIAEDWQKAGVTASPGRPDPIETEREYQKKLYDAGIVDDATAIAWMDGFRAKIEQDWAEYDALLDRHRQEVSAFLESKRSGC